MTALILAALPPFVSPFLLGNHVSRFLRITLIISLCACLTSRSLFLGGLVVLIDIQSPLSLHQCNSRWLVKLPWRSFVLSHYLIQVFWGLMHHHGLFKGTWARARSDLKEAQSLLLLNHWGFQRLDCSMRLADWCHFEFKLLSLMINDVGFEGAKG